MSRMRITVAGGGAAGFFGAITCAEGLPDADVVLIEKSPALLAKVEISGGGRCNVTHACFDPAELAAQYPRGGRELVGPFHRWQPLDTVRWFEERGVKLKTEPDGRIFPVTDKSSSIVDALVRAAREAGVTIRTRTGLQSVRAAPGGHSFELQLSDKRALECDRMLIATGGNKATAGFGVAASLGHTILEPVPSLFTFNIDDARLRGLEGISATDAEVSIEGNKDRRRGPVLVTHWGLSGPAVLKLSAWAARDLHDRGYDFDLNVNWAAGYPRQEVERLLANSRLEQARKTVAANPLFGLARRLWQRLVQGAGIGAESRWSAVTTAQVRALLEALTASAFHVQGKSLFKEEFVTCGGVSLTEVDFRTMESKIVPGLYFAGEVLDIDGVTGGFNLQSAWTTGWIAGHAMGQ